MVVGARFAIAIGLVGLSVSAVTTCSRFAPVFQQRFDRLTHYYDRALNYCLNARLVVLIAVLASATIAVVLSFMLKEVPLRTMSGMQAAQAAAAAADAKVLDAGGATQTPESIDATPAGRRT